MKPVRTQGLTLFEAICAWCDQELVGEFRELTEEGFDDDVTGFLVGDGPDQWKIFRYAELRDQLVRELLYKLCIGALVATGFDSRAPIDAPAREISAERWPLLTLNLRESSATFDGIKIIGITVRLAEETADAYPGSEIIIPSPEDLAAHDTGVPQTRRLVVKKAGKEVSLDGKPLKLTPLPFNLLLILAEEASASRSLVPHSKLKKALVSSGASDSAVGDAVRNLRQQIRKQFGRRFDVKQLVQNRLSLGYLLDLRPGEIQILP